MGEINTCFGGNKYSTRFPGKNFLTHCVGELGLDRSWKALLLGITDWSACRPGDFGARIRVASANSLVDRSQLKLLEADFYLIPPLDFSSAELTDLAWARQLTFTPGALVSTSDGSLEVWADLEYYSEMRIPLAGRGAESAMVATLRQGYEGAVAAMVTAGATTTLVSQLRPASKAGLVAAHVAKLPLPAPLQTFSPAGLAREAEAFTRVAYLASAGLGAAAERVVIPLLESALDWGEWAIVKTAVHGCLPGHPKVELLRRWQAVLSLAAPDTLTVGSLGRLATLLNEVAAVIRSPELAGLVPAARPEHFASGRSAALPYAARPLAVAGAAAEPGTTRQAGSLRLDAASVGRLLADQNYIDQKRAMLAFVAADKPLDALRVLLRGTLPPPANAAPGFVCPAQPLAVFHFLLSSEVESWLVEPELRPVDALRAHLPAYAGDVVLRAMRVDGEVKLELAEFVAKWRAPSAWHSAAGGLP